MIKLTGHWCSAGELESKTYKCGYCGEKVSINEGYVCRFTNNNIAHIYIYVIIVIGLHSLMNMIIKRQVFYMAMK